MKLARLIATSQITLKSATRNSCVSVLPNDFNASQPPKSDSRAFSTLSQKLLADHTYRTAQFIQNYDKKPFSVMSCRNCGSFSLPNINDDLVNATADINEFKIFMKSKNIDHQENHACLVITVPKYVFSTSETASSEFRNVPWSQVDEAVVKIHLNKTTKTFVCPELAVSGNMQLLTEFLNTWSYNRNLKKGSPEKELPVLELNRLFNPGHSVMGLEDWNRAEPIESLNETEFKELLKVLHLPTGNLFTLNDFAKFEARIVKNPTGGKLKRSAELLFPVRYVNGELIAIRKMYYNAESKSIQEETLGPHISNMMPFPHGLDQAYKLKCRQVVIVSSILDSMILTSSRYSLGTSAAVIALGEGTLSLPPDQLPFFDEEQFDLLTFWFPNTATDSMESIRSFSKKLGEFRCKMIPCEYPQPWVWSKTNKGATNARKFIEATARDCGHKHVTTFERLRHDVYLELLHHEEIKGTQWKRFDRLNDLLRGFRRGELTIFSGRTGQGKTTFMSEYSVDLCSQNIKTLWGSFEVKNTRLAKMQMKQFSGINLEENLDLFDKWANKFQKLPFYYLTFHGAQEYDQVLDAMAHAVYLYDISHVIIDNIQFMMGMSNSNDRFFAQDMIIHKFRKFATLHNVHVTLVIHPRKEAEDRLSANSIFGGAKATQEADNVLLLQEEIITERVKRKFVEVVKNRFSGDLGQVPLVFNPLTTTFSKKYAKSKTKKTNAPTDNNSASVQDETDS